MKNSRWIYIIWLLIGIITACQDNEHPTPETGDGTVRLFARMADPTRADDTETVPDGEYHLYYKSVYSTDNKLTAHKFTCTSGAFTPESPLYWDDIRQEAGKAQFYLTNTQNMSFASAKIEGKDILCGNTLGWNEPLTFTLEHLLAKVTVHLWDNTLNKDVDFKNAKAIFNPGFTLKTTGINYAQSKIQYLSTDKQKTTTISQFEGAGYKPESVEYNGVISKEPLYVVPQTFADTDSLEITAGKYVYRIPVPDLIQEDGGGRSINAGDHLTIRLQLTEDKITAIATLADWEEIRGDNIEVSRVFNMSNWNELRDMMHAINTGYTFKGMVVRLTKNIELQGQLSLGTEKYPFEGIFDGNGKTISNLGTKVGDNITYNTGGLFAYTRGATLQNISIKAPFVKSDKLNAVGTLVDNAENTTVFNCKTESDGTEAGRIIGTGDKVGGMVGTATGTSTLINCYSYVWVGGEGEYVGGLIGYSDASITHCFAKGEVDSSKATYVGGLAGYMTGKVLYCYAQGRVNGNSQIGGLIGYLVGEASDCYATGNVSGTHDRGGLFGNIGFGGVAEKCFWLHNDEYNGAGLANLNESCKAFDSTDDLLDADHLNDPLEEIWTKVSGIDYRFTND